jgi:nucleolar protein 58
MLLLFETAAGFALFKVLKEGKLQEADDLSKDFDSLDAAQKVRRRRGAAPSLDRRGEPA